MRHSKLTRRFAGFVFVGLGFGLSLALGGCQTIAGIDERKLDPHFDASEQCHEYCTNVMANCFDDNAVYPTIEQCLAVCSYLDPGEKEEAVGNTVACRAEYAISAQREPASDCKFAGPGGGGECGTDCEAYCTLFPQICKNDPNYKNFEYKTTEACITACGGLTDQDRFNLKKDHEGDSIECRLVHTSSASLKPVDHCPHAPIPPTQPWCTGAAKAAPSCDDYCKIELIACSGDLAQYASPKQCMDTCNALDLGTNADVATNTVGCRRYHSFNATFLPTSHCSHSGPTGDGHCGAVETGNCESYCKLAAAACPEDFDAGFGSADACMTACAELPEAAHDSKYSLTTAKASKGLHCRVLHAVEAFEDKTACASALGGDQCQ